VDTVIVGFPPDGRGRVGTFVITARGCGADGGAGRQVGTDGIIEAGRAPIGADAEIGTNMGVGTNRGLTSKNPARWLCRVSRLRCNSQSSN